MPAFTTERACPKSDTLLHFRLSISLPGIEFEASILASLFGSCEYRHLNSFSVLAGLMINEECCFIVYGSFAYSARAWARAGRLESADFQRENNCW